MVNNVIPYQVAIQQKPKTGTHLVTMVHWGDAPTKWIDIAFETVGVRRVALPVEGLPKGYRMITHASNSEAWASIYDESVLKTASFEYLDKVTRDFELIRKVTGADFGDLFLFDIRPDYIEWVRKFSDAWDVAIEALDATFEKAINNLYPELDETNGVGCRTMPPDYKTLIKKVAENMIAIVDSMD